MENDQSDEDRTRRRVILRVLILSSLYLSHLYNHICIFSGHLHVKRNVISEEARWWVGSQIGILFSWDVEYGDGRRSIRCPKIIDPTTPLFVSTWTVDHLSHIDRKSIIGRQILLYFIQAQI